MSKLLGEKLSYISIPEKQDDSETPKVWTIIENWIGDWWNETIQFGKDEKIRLIKLNDKRSLQSIKDETNYRLMVQVRCEPILE